MTAWEQEGQILEERRWADPFGVHTPPQQDQAGRGQGQETGSRARDQQTDYSVSG